MKAAALASATERRQSWPQARATLAAAAGVTAAADAARDPFAGELRLGVITTVAPYLLPIALPELAQALPRTPLYL
ncbi:MAG TPA: hypothetical protein VFE60_11350, partial [Roseiarcus sp.]|nr:hypothetical protein [Roseiarcus sp.]